MQRVKWEMREYTTNLLKLVIYVRSLLSNPQIRDYLTAKYADELEIFEQIINNTER